MNDEIDYQELLDQALRGVVRSALRIVEENGLPGKHHIYVSFLTQYPGVIMANHLLEKYPQEITIVLQNQFWDLSVSEEAFELTLSFGGSPEQLTVPFQALSGFADPSVQFGLQFKNTDNQLSLPNDEEANTSNVANITKMEPSNPNEDDKRQQESHELPSSLEESTDNKTNVIALKNFRDK